MSKPIPPIDDGLPIADVGAWSKDKHHFLERYLFAFTTAMANKKQWNGIHYIDLFAGSGVSRIRNTSTLIWGSPLLAAQTPKPFNRLHLCEKNPSYCDALRKRLGKFSLQEEPFIVEGDANDKVADIISNIPSRALSLAFLDPYGFHLNFSTFEQLAKIRCDLIVYFGDYVDAVRNWKEYSKKEDSNLDRFFGANVDWRSALGSVPTNQIADKLLKLFLNRMKPLGYTHHEHERIYANNRPLYKLVFFSKHQMGVKIWQGVSLKKPDNQRSFDFQ